MGHLTLTILTRDIIAVAMSVVDKPLNCSIMMMIMVRIPDLASHISTTRYVSVRSRALFFFSCAYLSPRKSGIGYCSIRIQLSNIAIRIEALLGLSLEKKMQAQYSLKSKTRLVNGSRRMFLGKKGSRRKW